MLKNVTAFLISALSLFFYSSVSLASQKEVTLLNEKLTKSKLNLIFKKIQTISAINDDFHALKITEKILTKKKSLVHAEFQKKLSQLNSLQNELKLNERSYKNKTKKFVYDANVLIKAEKDLKAAVLKIRAELTLLEPFWKKYETSQAQVATMLKTYSERQKNRPESLAFNAARDI